MPFSINNIFINRFGLILCTLLIFSGQITINRFMPINGFMGDIKANFLILFLLIILLIYTRSFLSINLYVKKFLIKIFIATSLILLCNTLIDLIDKRKINIDFNLDVSFIAITSALICVFIRNKNDFLFLMRSIAIISIFLAFTNFIVWENGRVILLTQITSNRIILFGLGAATLLFIENLKLGNLLLIVTLSFLASYGSLKMGLLAFGLYLILSITMLITYEKFKAAKLFLFAIIIGVYIGYANNNFQDIKSRIDLAAKKSSIYNITAENFIAPGRLGATEELGAIEENLAAQCRESINYNYCISDKYFIRDSTERIRMWSHALDIIRANPFFGVGDDGYNLRLAYRYSSGNNIYDYKYPHNIFLNLAVEFGLIFTLLIGGIIYLCFMTAVRVSIFKPEFIGLVAAGAAIFFASNTGGNLYDARYIFFMFVLACLYGDVSNYQQLKSELVKLQAV